MIELISFFIYCVLIFLMLYVFKKKVSKSVYLLVSIIVALFASVRGECGPDSELYMLRYELVELVDVSFYEPIMSLSMLLSRDVFNLSWEAYSFLHALLVLLLWSLTLRNQQNTFFVSSVFAVIAIDSVFNGMRVGLVYPLAAYLILTADRRYLWTLALFTHVSSVVMLVMNELKRPLVIVIIFGVGWFVFTEGYLIQIAENLSKYSVIEAKNWYSGIFDGVMLVTALAHLFSKGKNSKALILILLLFIGFIIFQQLLILRYSGLLRVIRLLLIVFLVKGLRYKEADYMKNIGFTFGALYVLNFLRQIWSSRLLDQNFIPFQWLESFT